MKKQSVWLSSQGRIIVREAISEAAEGNGLSVLAMTVRNGHVHIVLGYDDRSIGDIVAILKAAGRGALGRNGFEGRVWSTGYDVQYCFDAGALRGRIGYVERHEQ